MIHKTLDGDKVEFTCEALVDLLFFPKIGKNDRNDEKCGSQLDDFIKHDRLRSEFYDLFAEN